VVKIGLDPGNARDETVDFVLAKAGVFEGEFRGFDVKLGGAEMRDDADLGIGCADDRDLVLQRCRGNSSVHRELCSKRHRAQDVTIQNLALFYRFGHSRRSKAVLTERTRPFLAQHVHRRESVRTQTRLDLGVCKQLGVGANLNRRFKWKYRSI
jgi:hypothetical protein